MDKFSQIEQLDYLLTEADIPHTFEPLFDGYQIRVYADAEMTKELDDAICHGGSNGSCNGLLETYILSGCDGWETAEQVFDGWKKMYEKPNGIAKDQYLRLFQPWDKK